MRLFIDRFVIFSVWVVIAMGMLALLTGAVLWFWPWIVCKVVAGTGIALGFFAIGSIIWSFVKASAS